MLFDSRPTVASPHPLLRDRSATFFKIFPNRLKRPKNVVWQSADGRVTPTTVAWPFSDFFQNFPKSLETSKNVVWQSADGRVTSDHCRVTVQQIFSNFFLNAWNVQKTLFDSRPTVAWLQPLSRDRSATFFKIFPNRLKRPKNVVWQSADGRVTSDHCRVTDQRLFQKISNCLKRRKIVVWQSADSRVTSDHCRVTVQRLFSKIFPNRLKRPKNVAWQSADGRVTSDHCRVTVQRLFSKFFRIAWNVQKTLFDSQPTVAWPPTTVAWPFSDFFQIFFLLLETSKKRCLTVSRRSRDFRPLSRDRSATFFKIFANR